jgi:F-type H+-transporting ATPase subunit a
MMIRLIVMTVLIVLFWLWTRKFKQAVKTGNVVPGRFQLLGELALYLVRTISSVKKTVSASSHC